MTADDLKDASSGSPTCTSIIQTDQVTLFSYNSQMLSIVLDIKNLLEDPLLLFESLASLSLGLAPSERISWIISQAKYIIKSLSMTQTLLEGKIVKFKAWVQQDNLQDEYFVPFDPQTGKFILFDEEDLGERSFLFTSSNKLSGHLVSRRVIRIGLYDDLTTSFKAVIYEPFTVKMGQVLDVAGIVDLDGTLHVIDIQPWNSHQTDVLDHLSSSTFEILFNAFHSMTGCLKTALALTLFGYGTTSFRQTGLLSSLLIGCHQLNIQISSEIDSIESLVGLIQSMRPVRLIKLTMDSMASCKLYPSLEECQIEEDICDTQLVPGLLQLPSGYAIIVDETELTEGKLDAHATTNLKALQSMITHQLLQVHLSNQTLVEIPCDNPVLVISRGKSILDLPLTIKINQLADLDKPVNTFHVQTENARSLVHKMSIPESLSAHIEQAYHAHRSNNPDTKFEENTLALSLNMLRLITGARLKTEAELEDWHQAFDLSLHLANL